MKAAHFAILLETTGPHERAGEIELKLITENNQIIYSYRAWPLDSGQYENGNVPEDDIAAVVKHLASLVGGDRVTANRIRQALTNLRSIRNFIRAGALLKIT